MDNGLENMLDMYLFETNSLLEQLEEIMLEAEKSQTLSMDDINEIFRIMHTIKGSSAMMEFSSLMKIAHRIEDLFFFIRENNGIGSFDQDIRRELFDLVFRSNDYMGEEVAKIENKEPLSSNIDQFITDINTFLDKIKSTSTTLDNENSLNTSVDEQTSVVNHDKQDSSAYTLKVFFEEGSGMENLRAFMLITSIGELCEDFDFQPSDVETNPGSCSIILEKGFLLNFKNETDLNKAISVIKNSANIGTYEIIEHTSEENINNSDEDKVTSSPSSELNSDVLVEIQKQQKTTSPSTNTTTHNNQNKQSIISVNLSKLDQLMAIVGEIVITESMVTSSPEIQGIKLDSFTKSARQLRKLTDELQDIAMSIRMVPLSGAFHKMNRIIRDMGQKLNKDVRLIIIGEDTELDKTIVDGIGDPIMHIIRNAMDHGIEETVEERISAGKDPQGEIILEAKHTGSDVIITVKDDGKGINPAKILEKAKQNNLLTKPESEYTKKEILSMLLMPGFSTNEKVTEFSGRGVGMDVVKKNVEQVGGIVTITSEMNEGTCISLKIPLTLAIVAGMEVAVGKSIFTIPITNIRQSFKVSESEVIHDASKGELIRKMDDFYPIIRIHELYNIETEITNIEDGIIVWVEASDKSYCLFVDELIGEQQVVVKPLPIYLNSFHIKHAGIAGCTILGDGNISIILDILNLYTTSNNY